MPDNDHVVTSTANVHTSADGNTSWLAPEVQLRRISDGEALWSYVHETPYFAGRVQVSPKRDVVSGCMESSIVILDAKTGELKRRIFVNE
jgi:hypothetical protein